MKLILKNSFLQENRIQWVNSKLALEAFCLPPYTQSTFLLTVKLVPVHGLPNNFYPDPTNAYCHPGSLVFIASLPLASLKHPTHSPRIYGEIIIMSFSLPFSLFYHQKKTFHFNISLRSSYKLNPCSYPITFDWFLFMWFVIYFSTLTPLFLFN